MSRHRQLLLTTLAVALSVLAACSPATAPAPASTLTRLPATPTAPVALLDTEWTLAMLRGEAPVAGSSLTLAFHGNDYMEGTAGCNSFGAEYSANNVGFHIIAIHRTDFECADSAGIMSQDREFFEALESISAYRATEDRLEFDNAAGETVLVYARKHAPVVDPALRDTEWLLISLLRQSVSGDPRITLNLGTHGFGGYAGCNNYGGEYEAADDGTLLLSEIYSTLMDCASEAIMEQEAAYIQALRSSASYRLVDGRLEIADASGETILEFARKEEFATDPGALVGTAWRLTSVYDDSLGDDSTITLVFFSERILGGHAGCRDYLATYEASGDDLTLLLEAMFDAACRTEDAAFEQEGRFLDVMAPKADLRLGEGFLEIHGERGRVLLFEPLPEETNLDLEGRTWSLLAFIEPKPFAQEIEPWLVPNGPLLGTTIDLKIEWDAVRGSSGCNDYGANYSRAGSSIRFETITATKMACHDPDGIMGQEGHYLSLLGAVTGYHIYGDLLCLDAGDGQALIFFGTDG